ncbi:MAG: hypothetical protein FJZ15_07905, partial [Candidatus Omnitrophica bacterium]|nr:hypothetical protein [Candidatus Omnitrophota bacterium]
MIKAIFLNRSRIAGMVMKDLKLRYARPSLGVLWAFLSPIFIATVFFIVFSVILKVSIREAPYMLYLMSAVFTWRFFQESLTQSVTSLVDNKYIIKESRFPHYIIPLSITIANFINCLPSLVLLAVLTFLKTQYLSWPIIFLPAVLLLHFTVTASLASISAILYVKFRDIKNLLEVMLTALFYLTPVFYSVAYVKESFSAGIFNLYMLNPFVGILDLYR